MPLDPISVAFRTALRTRASSKATPEAVERADNHLLRVMGEHGVTRLRFVKIVGPEEADHALPTAG